MIVWIDFYRFCIIEGPETVEDFAKMELQEIRDNIRSRRNKIFLHMEEVCLLFFRICIYYCYVYLALCLDTNHLI